MGTTDKKWIWFNVGGTHFMTSRSTITKTTPSNSPLCRAASNSTNVEWDRDERGAFIIDRDPSYFQVVINFLRYGRLLIGHSIPDEAIIIEAEYYNIPELSKAIRRRVVGTLLEQPEYLTNYVNGILEDDVNKFNMRC